MLRMGDAEVLPYDYESYGKEIETYLEAAEKLAAEHLGDKAPSFAAAKAASSRFAQAGAAIRSAALANVASPANAVHAHVTHATSRVQNEDNARSAADRERLNKTLMATERALLLPAGLPRRPWFRHAIYAPADLKGYSASTIPGVNEAIQRNDAVTTTDQLNDLTKALNRAAAVLESYKPEQRTVGQQR